MAVHQTTELPEDASFLRTLANSEGHGHLDRLINDFHSGKNRFEKMGEALFVVRNGDCNKNCVTAYH